MLCPNCGREIPDESEYCLFCGQEIKPRKSDKYEDYGRVRTPKTYKKKKKKKKNNLLSVLIIVAVAFAITAAMILVLNPVDIVPGISSSSSGRSESSIENGAENSSISSGSDSSFKADSSSISSASENASSESSSAGSSAAESSAAEISSPENSAETSESTENQGGNIQEYEIVSSLSNEFQLLSCVSAASATSYLIQDDTSIDNSARMAFDGDTVTSWQEGSSGDGTGQALTAAFDGSETIYAIGFYLGNWRNEELHSGNNTPASLEVKLGSYKTLVDFSKEMQPYYMVFTEPIETASAVFTIESVYASDSGDCCISEIEFYTK